MLGMASATEARGQGQIRARRSPFSAQASVRLHSETLTGMYQAWKIEGTLGKETSTHHPLSAPRFKNEQSQLTSQAQPPPTPEPSLHGGGSMLPLATE